MVRSQIQFTEEQHRLLKRWARQRDISISEAVRRCVDERLAAERVAPTRAMMVREALAAPTYKDREGKTDVAVNHDKYLVEAYSS